MKKRGLLIIAGIMLCCLTILTACDKQMLPAPINLRFDEQVQEVVWEQVDYATGGYKVEISGKDIYGNDVVSHELAATDEDGKFQFWYSLADYETGTYVVRVKALTIDANYYRDSDWSESIICDIKKESGIEYRLINDGTEYEVSKIGTAGKNIIIFDEYNGKPITKIGDSAFSGNASKLTGIVIGNNVKSIGVAAFASCKGLISITLPDGLISIGERAFQKCEALQSIKIPDSVTTIDQRAFADCYALTDITIPETITEISDYLFFNCTGLATVTMGEKVSSFGTYSFYGCSSLKSIDIPSSVKTLGIGTFMSSAIENVNFQEESGLKSIGYMAFSYCVNLADIDIPESVAKIGGYAFHQTEIWNNADDVVYADNWLVECKDFVISSVIVTSGTVGISDFAFLGRNISTGANVYLTALTSITIPNSVINVGSYAFYDTGIWENAGDNNIVYADKWVVGCKNKEIVSAALVNTTVGISDDAFYLCTSLTAVSNYSNVKSIGDYAFYKCYNLNLTISQKIVKIGDYAFYATSISSLTVPAAITTISDYAFYACSSLQTVILHNQITSIGKYAFAACGALTVMAIPDSVTYMGEYVFAQTGIKEIVFPNSLTSISDYAFYNADISSVTMGENVTSIGDYAFNNCVNLTDVVIPEGVTTIGKGAFKGNYNLTTSIPSTVTSIGAYAFAECWYKLDNIVIPDGVTRINEYTFYECKNLSSIVIPDSVTSIGESAFTFCSRLESITIGSNIIGIGKYVFYGCSSLTVYTEASKRQESWSVHWNPTGCSVVWDCTASADKEYVASVKVTEGSIVYGEDVVFLSAPYREGYTFGGWTYTSGSITADENDFYGVLDGSVLYAIWIADAE